LACSRKHLNRHGSLLSLPRPRRRRPRAKMGPSTRKQRPRLQQGSSPTTVTTPGAPHEHAGDLNEKVPPATSCPSTRMPRIVDDLRRRVRRPNFGPRHVRTTAFQSCFPGDSVRFGRRRLAPRKVARGEGECLPTVYLKFSPRPKSVAPWATRWSWREELAQEGEDTKLSRLPVEGNLVARERAARPGFAHGGILTG